MILINEDIQQLHYGIVVTVISS